MGAAGAAQSCVPDFAGGGDIAASGAGGSGAGAGAPTVGDDGSAAVAVDGGGDGDGGSRPFCSSPAGSMVCSISCARLTLVACSTDLRISSSSDSRIIWSRLLWN